MTVQELVDKYGTTEFHCPNCGSSRFGSSNCTSKDDMTRHCHGCREFSWHERDDHRYLYVVITFLEKNLKAITGNE